jgi:FKBP-type peptidyl-prolyl cis-trans isomerase (trigger factor)
MSKAVEFNKRNAKLAVAQQQSNAESLNMLRQTLSGMYQKIFELQNKLESLTGSAKAADWRSLAIMKLLNKAGISEDEVTAKAEELQVNAFNKESELDDEAKNLENHDGTAENGMTAIAQIKVFKDGAELTESQVVRSKFELGRAELLPEIDEAVLGMTPGTKKKFPLSLSGKTDEAEVSLIALRKPKSQSTPSDSTQEQSNSTS